VQEQFCSVFFNSDLGYEMDFILFIYLQFIKISHFMHEFTYSWRLDIQILILDLNQLSFLIFTKSWLFGVAWEFCCTQNLFKLGINFQKLFLEIL